MKFSIITINYNNLIGLKKTAQSVLLQNFSDFEYIIIDGDSSDGALMYIRQLSKQFALTNFKFVCEKDKGIYDAMNKGILLSSGEYILFLNSGDRLTEEKTLESLNQNIDNSDIIYGNRINCKNDILIKTVKYNQTPLFSWFLKDALPHQSTIFRRSLFRKIGLYNIQRKYAADWEFYLIAMFLFNCKYKYIDLCISKYDIEGISSNIENRKEMFQERELIIKEHFPLFYPDYIRYFKMQNDLDSTDSLALNIGKIILRPYRKIKKILLCLIKHH